MKETQKEKLFQDKLKPVQGYFRIETYDVNDNLINLYEDNNKIMARVPYNITNLFYGASTSGFNNEIPPNTPISKFAIGTIAIGTDGIDSEGFEKEIECNRDMLFSEQRLWQGKDDLTNTSSIDDLNKYVYQTTFTANPVNTNFPDDLVPATKVSEGPSYPWNIITNTPTYYRTNATIPGFGLEFEDTSMTVKSNIKDTVISYEFTLGQFAGNGVWAQAPAFSEAALYMRYIPIRYNGLEDGRPLGAMFSMKTFPKQYKTEACYFRIKWKLIFGTDICLQQPPTLPPTHLVEFEMKVTSDTEPIVHSTGGVLNITNNLDGTWQITGPTGITEVWFEK